jgi:hypothetical protein
MTPSVIEAEKLIVVGVVDYIPIAVMRNLSFDLAQR